MGQEGDGTALVEYTVDPNPKSTLRSADLTIAGQTFTIRQGPGR